MRARSPAALAKRAAKRGRTVEEERQAERKKEKERSKAKERAQQQMTDMGAGDKCNTKIEEHHSKRGNAKAVEVWKARNLGMVEREGKLKRDEKAGWMCMAETNQEKSRRCGFINFPHRTVCLQCNALRGVSSKDSSNPAQKKDHAKTRRQERPSDPARAWASTANVTQEHLDQNKRLRELFVNDPTSLTDEQRQRAQVLIERDARKRARKSEIKQSKRARQR